MRHRKRPNLTVSIVLGFTALISIPLHAQDEQSYDEDETVLEEVIVTGSRIINKDGFGQTSPVTVVSMDDITSTGLTRVEDVLNSLPSIETAQHSFIANGTTGTASIDLRGLGSSRTLVLFNGRRMQPGGVFANAPDMNQIPSAMIDRIEVLTGGASATYGADAVAGVVNFIMRRVSGVEISVGASAYQHSNRNRYIQDLMDKKNFEYPTGNSGLDGKTYNVDILAGHDFDSGRGNATVYVTWRDNEELKQEARDYSSCALNMFGSACGGSPTAIVPNFYIAPIRNGAMDWSDSQYLTLNPDSSLGPSSRNVYNFAPVNHFMRPDERWSIGSFIDYEINESAILYLETNHASDHTSGQIAESGTFFEDEYRLPLDNSVFPEGFRRSLTAYWPGEDEFGIYVGKRNVEGGPRASVFDHDSFRIVTGTRGHINPGWDYDLSYLYADTSSSIAYINDFFGPRIAQAVNGDLCAADPTCVPYEVFTFQGVTAEMALPLLGRATATGESSTRVINGYVTGDLGWSFPATKESILVVAGLEHRVEKFQRISDPVFQQGLLLGQNGPTPSIDGSYTVAEVFAESNISLVSDMAGFQALTLDLAYRYSDYSTSGGASTYRVGLDWKPVEMLRLRTGYNRAVRAPNVTDLFSTQTNGLWAGDDPCSGPSPVMTFEQCARQGVTAAQYGNITESPVDQYNAIYGGNPELDPEIADTYTLGLVVNPAESMQIALDYWRIEIDEAINNIGARSILEQCGLNNQLCELVSRNSIGSLWIGTEGYIMDTTNNLGSQVWSGIDVAFMSRTQGLGGTWTTRLIGTYMLTKETTLLPADTESSYDCVGLASARCYPTPEWRHTASVGFDSGKWWSVTGRWRYFGGVGYDGSIDTLADKELNAQSYLDLSAVFRFMESHDIVIGINNLLDEEPPLLGGTLSTNANTIAGFYDSLGRYFSQASLCCWLAAQAASASTQAMIARHRPLRASSRPGFIIIGR